LKYSAPKVIKNQTAFWVTIRISSADALKWF